MHDDDSGLRLRFLVDEELRIRPEKKLLTPGQLSTASIELPELQIDPTHTFFHIMERERESLHIPTSRHSLNVAQFVAFISALTEGIDLQSKESEMPDQFKNFQGAFRRINELSLISFDMDNLTSTNDRYSHLHGSIVCSTLERTILEAIEPFNGLLASMGEENLVALPMEIEDAYLVGDFMVKRFNSINFDFGNGEFNQGVSGGISSLKNCNPSSFRRLMELSGGALVYSKKNGKGMISIFGEK